MAKKSSQIGAKLLRLTNLHNITVKQVYAYVKALHLHIRKQNQKIRVLRRKLKNVRKLHRLKSSNRQHNSDEDSEKENADDDVMQALERAEKQQILEQNAANNDEPLDVKAFVDDIKKTAEDFDYQNRYIYEPTSGLYYDPVTGYYYNAIYGLHYDGQRGCYLKYNEKTQQYEFHSQVMPEKTLEDKKHLAQQKKRKEEKPIDRSRRRQSWETTEERPKRLARSRNRRRNRSRSRGDRERSYSDSESSQKRRMQSRKRRQQSGSRSSPEVLESKTPGCSSDEDIQSFFRFVRNTPQKKRNRRRGRDSADHREDGELDSSSSSSSSCECDSGSVVIVKSSASESDGAAVEFPGRYSETVKNYPPSLRLIVQKTNIDALREGSLFIVTCKGGTLGREGNHDVIIPDLNVSKYHLKFSYSDKHGVYQVVDLGSRNGTILNGTRMSGTMQESDPFDIEHGHVIQLNQTILVCHVHDGNITCNACEPGLLVKGLGRRSGAGIRYDANRITEPVSHKEGLKRLQKMYGLENEKYIEPTEVNLADYKDRAAHRRKTKGSSNEHAKTQVASVEQHIGSENKGFKMLSKLGWSEGQALGKKEEGLLEPIPLLTNVGTSGLGSQALAQPTAGQSANERKQMIWKMAQKRYESCAEVMEKKTSGDSSAKSPAASLAQHIGSENKGFQMLSKLGWNAGETLGANEDGLKEPIKLLTNVGTSGLGSQPLKDPSRVAAGNASKKLIWKKRQKKCETNDMFGVSDSE
ncbi:angiogenic factor with G patch and FHA domains 1 isoform X1 [Sabethes cyaneus]|uniref:angiogenic factor with G patch and FHA domains 1 isoform X1 n=1 Tax=Sabethes cyaneus TaxID=53552 RepID=UPI00237E08D3|nr:angiogenic factor with G patch and FHA domains 1 isoform X1 [Sabethes cyaneus]